VESEKENGDEKLCRATTGSRDQKPVAGAWAGVILKLRLSCRTMDCARKGKGGQAKPVRESLISNEIQQEKAVGKKNKRTVKAYTVIPPLRLLIWGKKRTNTQEHLKDRSRRYTSRGGLMEGNTSQKRFVLPPVHMHGCPLFRLEDSCLGVSAKSIHH